jgi:hypothetical protein
MAVGRKTGGRRKGSLNKAKPGVKAQQVFEAQLERALAKGKKSPLEVMLEFMRDEENPPGFRGEMAKAAAPYVHSKGASQRLGVAPRRSRKRPRPIASRPSLRPLARRRGSARSTRSTRRPRT